MNCAVVIYGTNRKASTCTASDAFLLARASVVLNQTWRKSSIFGSAGQPNHDLSPRLTIGTLAGESMSGPTNQVWKMDQPPLTTGSFEVRRVMSVPQSPACSSTLRPSLRNSSAVISDCECTIGWSVAEIMTILSPL